ncbi:glycosyltransferase family 4 protein [Denitrificimonas caeni]|uniref:glycosyltransferase family 4 protein n=1 Tax=Denitrificimonas caeni TaxID=521720 RepID=UPI001964A270|nr:glycosyltransferase family 4 protein [Denitrificimonas caeni]
MSKIFLLSPLPPPVGGIASWTVNVLDYYQSNGNVTIVHQDTAVKSRAITDSGVASRVIAGSKDALGIIASFYQLIRNHKPDVIHMTSSGSMGLWRDLLLSLLASFYRIPIVIHFRFGRIPEISRLNNWEWKLLKRVVSLTSAVMVLDNETHQVLSASGFENIYNIPNPVSGSVAKLLNKDNQVINEDNYARVEIIFVGHVVKNKGVFELVKACSLLSNVDELLLIGPYEDDVKESLLKSTAGTSVKISLLGVLTKEDILAQMRSASMLVLPSYSEGFPNVIIEAMAMKCPVIATNVGAIASMLDAGSEKPCGIVIEPKDVQSLVEAINVMITDTAKTELFKENAFSKVKEQYTLEKVCSQYEKVWDIAYQQGKAKNV